MKCNHCGKDIPQRLILAEAARILAKQQEKRDEAQSTPSTPSTTSNKSEEENP